MRYGDPWFLTGVVLPAPVVPVVKDIGFSQPSADPLTGEITIPVPTPEDPSLSVMPAAAIVFFVPLGTEHNALPDVMTGTPGVFKFSVGIGGPGNYKVAPDGVPVGQTYNVAVWPVYSE